MQEIGWKQGGNESENTGRHALRAILAEITRTSSAERQELCAELTKDLERKRVWQRKNIRL